MSNPRKDRTFKQIFHNHPRSLIHLLNAFLPLSVPIESIEYMPEELQAETDGYYMSIVDVRCRDRLGRHFIVEMQIQKTAHFEQRVMLNAFRLYTRQMLPGGSLSDLKPVYALCLLDYIMFQGHPDWIHHVEPRTRGLPSTPVDGVSVTFVEIKKWQEFDNLDLGKHENAWMLFFTQPEKVMEVFTPEQREELDELIVAVNAWDLTKYTERELLIKDRKMDRMLSHEMVVSHLMEEGKQKGLEEGLQEGMQQGMQQGMQRILEAITFLLKHPETSDDELTVRFGLSEDVCRQARSSLLL